MSRHPQHLRRLLSMFFPRALERSPRSCAQTLVLVACLVVGGGGTALAANMFTGADIVDDSLTHLDLADGSVRESELAGASVGNSEIQGGAVDTQNLANLAVNAQKLATGSVTRGKLVDNAVNGPEDCRRSGRLPQARRRQRRKPEDSQQRDRRGQGRRWHAHRCRHCEQLTDRRGRRKQLAERRRSRPRKRRWITLGPCICHRFAPRRRCGHGAGRRRRQPQPRRYSIESADRPLHGRGRRRDLCMCADQRKDRNWARQRGDACPAQQFRHPSEPRLLLPPRHRG